MAVRLAWLHPQLASLAPAPEKNRRTDLSAAHFVHLTGVPMTLGYDERNIYNISPL